MAGTPPKSDLGRWIWDQVQEIQRETRDAHQRLRVDLNAGLDRLREEIRGYREESSHVDRRLLVLETEHKDERNATLRRQWAIGLLVPVALWALARLIGWIER